MDVLCRLRHEALLSSQLEGDVVFLSRMAAWVRDGHALDTGIIRDPFKGFACSLSKNSLLDAVAISLSRRVRSV